MKFYFEKEVLKTYTPNDFTLKKLRKILKIMYESLPLASF